MGFAKIANFWRNRWDAGGGLSSKGCCVFYTLSRLLHLANVTAQGRQFVAVSEAHCTF